MHLFSVLPALALSTLTVARLHIVRVAPNGDMVSFGTLQRQENRLKRNSMFQLSKHIF